MSGPDEGPTVEGVPRMPKIAVIALGGNAFTRSGQTGTYEQQRRNALAMARSVLAIRRAGWNVVLVHGNGPQVGNLAIQQEEGRHLVPAQPLFSLGAMTQGEIGSLICLALRALDADLAAVALITHVVVAPDDPAFGAPTKPIGPFFSHARAAELAEGRDWSVAEDSGRGFRRLVPSPRPVEIVEATAVKSLVSGGTVVIAGGGGGVPVARRRAGLAGVEAVIDKDYVAGQLATALAAQALVFVTDVRRLMLDFGQSTERALDELDVATAERYQRDGHFPAGSMGPKVDAATQFLRSGGELAVISTAQSAALTLDPPGDTTGSDEGIGTRIMATRRTARITT
jgi:carbamate kinase